MVELVEYKPCVQCVMENRKRPNPVFVAELCRTHYRHLRAREKAAKWKGEPIPDAADFHVWPLKYAEYEHQLEWLRLYQQHPWLLLMAPCDHGKTISLVSYLAFRIGENPDIRCVVCSSVAGVANLIVGAVVSHLESNRDYIRYFERIHGFKPKPDRPKLWMKSAVTLNRKSTADAIKDPTLVAIGKGGELENRRIDLFCGDDMITLKAAESEVQRDTDRRWFLDVVMTRGEEECEVKIDGSPEHPDDLYELIASGKTETGEKFTDFFHVIRTRALAPVGEAHCYTNPEHVVNELDYGAHELHALCEDMMSKKELIRRGRLSQSTFMRKYQCRHASSKSRMYPPAQLEACKDPDLTIAESFDKFDREYRAVVLGIDIATGHAVSFFAMCLLGVDMKYNHVIINLFRERIRFVEQLEWIVKWYRKYVPMYVGVESNGQQEEIIDAFKAVRQVDGVDVTGIETIPFESVFTERTMIRAMTTSTSSMLDRGLFVFPDGDKAAHETIEPLINEMARYPTSQMKDCLMALLIAEQLYITKGTQQDAPGSKDGVPTIRGAMKRRVRGRRQTRYVVPRQARQVAKKDPFHQVTHRSFIQEILQSRLKN